jgi:hypothetical protein
MRRKSSCAAVFSDDFFLASRPVSPAEGAFDAPYSPRTLFVTALRLPEAS